VICRGGYCDRDRDRDRQGTAEGCFCDLQRATAESLCLWDSSRAALIERLWNCPRADLQNAVETLSAEGSVTDRSAVAPSQKTERCVALLCDSLLQRIDLQKRIARLPKKFPSRGLRPLPTPFLLFSQPDNRATCRAPCCAVLATLLACLARNLV
jgi:hypothetical protein